MEIDEKIQYTIAHTEVLRSPKQNLATFGITNIYYYLVTELIESTSIVREGRVIAAKPRIVTPAYLINLEGFSGQAKRYIEMIAEKDPHEAGIFYSYKNEPKEMNIVSDPLGKVVEKIGQQIDSNGDPLTAIIKGVEDMWDVSLLKFTYELTNKSVYTNVAEMGRRGLLRMDNEGIPADARKNIEELFEKTRRDSSFAPILVAELNRWGLFHQYQDRFLSLFKK
jgi:hypothetical protein